jgi:transglutaminase-like putative cysteine protease
MEFDLSAQRNGEEVRLWIPYPVSDRDQLIANVKIGGDAAETAIYTDRVFGQPMLFARWDKAAQHRKLTFTFAVEREEVIRRNFPAREAAWDPSDYAEFLKPTSRAPTDGPVKKLADEITKGKTTVQDKARAIYDWICSNMYRDPLVQGCGAGDVCALIDRKRGGKCVDIHAVFVALARAAGVPSREVFGIRLGQNDAENITTAQHCWVEFFLPGYGWVPADPADVRKVMLSEKLDLNDPRTAQYRDCFWGRLDACRLRLGLGRDLILNPSQNGEPVNYLMYPFAQVGEKTLDWLNPDTFKYTITYRNN